MLKSTFAFTFVIIGLIAATSSAASFSYRAEVPNTGLSCSENAQSIGSLFQKVTGASVSSSSCVSQNKISESGHIYTTDIIRVDYQASGEMNPTKAIFGGQEFLGNIFEHSGLFPTYAQCMSQLPLQRKNFETETTLLSVVAYCENAGDSQSPSYSLVVEGFGAGKKRLFLYSDIAVRMGSATSGAMSEAEGKVITEAGSHIALSTDGRIFYYSNYPVSVGVSELGFFSIPSECTDQLPTASAIYTNAGASSITPFCINNVLMVVSGDRFKVQEYFSDKTPIYSRILQNYAAMGENLLGAICTKSYSSFDQIVVKLFRQGE
jgi:hypothetical protein